MIQVDEKWLNNNTGKYRCPHCSKEYTKKGISTHILRTHMKDDRFSKSYNHTGTSWNKGLTKDNDSRIKQYSETLKKTHQEKGSYWSGKTLPKEMKDKISSSRIQYLKENPDKVPYVLNHYSKGESYPEQYFRSLFDKNDIQYEQEKREGLYSLDFVIGRYNIEIDGEQHYLDERIKQSDIKRTKYLEGLGYKVIRIRWSEYQSLKDKKEFVKKLLEEIR